MLTSTDFKISNKYIKRIDTSNMEQYDFGPLHRAVIFGSGSIKC